MPGLLTGITRTAVNTGPATDPLSAGLDHLPQLGEHTAQGLLDPAAFVVEKAGIRRS